MRNFKPYSKNTTYLASNDQHAPTVGQIGHGAIVKFCDGETGVVIASNTEKALVDYGREQGWFNNVDLKVATDFIGS
jgi:uncharacterized protein YkvS